MINSLNVTNFASTYYSWSPGIYSGKNIYFVVSNYWFPSGERHIVAFDVLSETFSTLPFPEVLEVNPWQGHFLSIAMKLYLIVVGRLGSRCLLSIRLILLIILKGVEGLI
ncbi:hypothetical protein Hanom_Chr06g00528291 [Helianthus anomalus]